METKIRPDQPDASDKKITMKTNQEQIMLKNGIVPDSVQILQAVHNTLDWKQILINCNTSQQQRTPKKNILQCEIIMKNHITAGSEVQGK